MLNLGGNKGLFVLKYLLSVVRFIPVTKKKERFDMELL
jgi:hypothetical protein